jgi:hypothetical protein
MEVGEMHFSPLSLLRGSFGRGVLAQGFEGEGGEALGSWEGFVFDRHTGAAGEAAMIFLVHVTGMPCQA